MFTHHSCQCDVVVCHDAPWLSRPQGKAVFVRFNLWCVWRMDVNVYIVNQPCIYAVHEYVHMIN